MEGLAWISPVQGGHLTRPASAGVVSCVFRFYASDSVLFTILAPQTCSESSTS
jgi:hypothetical protein